MRASRAASSSRRIPTLIHEASLRYGLQPRVIAAVIYQESKGDAWAVRYEPLWFERNRTKLEKNIKEFFPGKGICSKDTELRSRAYSWGLMQILGETARVYGFNSPFLAELLDPEENIDLGSRILRDKLADKGNLKDGLLAYNGGANKSYPDEVIALIEGVKIDFLLT